MASIPHILDSGGEHHNVFSDALAVEGEGVGWSELAEMGMRDGPVQGVVPR